jgi:SH3 domain-containing YSC84-like protein 1
MSAPSNNQQTHGQNPDYYAETASVAGPSGTSHAASEQNPPQYQEMVHPPPTAGQQDYYPPPPPGPPPNQSQNQGYQAYHPLQSNPADYSQQSPPSYEPTPGLEVHGDEKPPVLPPRPSSSQGQAAPYFPPPPGAAETQPQPQSSQPQGAGPSTTEAQTHGSVGPAVVAAGNTGAAIGAASQSQQTADGKKKKTFGERFYDWSVKAGVPVNKITNKLGSEAFWPTSMDKECDKAARILKSFCSMLSPYSCSSSDSRNYSNANCTTEDGFYTESTQPPPSPGHATNPGPTHNPKAKTLVKVPSKAIAQAKGIAIFTVFRTGLHISGASGSGIVMSRLPDGSWSPPSGFLVHTLGAGFMVGLDIYDCVCVLNTEEAVKAFTKPRFSLGGEIAVVAGPVGAGTSVDAAIGASAKPVWSYMKSRGFYAGIQADGTVIVQRPDANAAFYAEKGITPERVLRGDVKPHQGLVSDGGKGEIVPWPLGARQLMEVLKSAEGGRADEKVVEEVGKGPTPGDLAGTEGVGHGEPSAQGGVHPQGDVKYA